MIAVLLVVSVGGYLSLGDQKEDFMSDPLDAIGARFAGLMTNETDKAEFDESFAEFRQKVMDKEVSPEQFESVAATILNMEAAGEQLTWEEAEMVLSLASEPIEAVLPTPAVPPVADAAPAAPVPQVATSVGSNVTVHTVDVSPERYREMSDRVAQAFAAADEMKALTLDADLPDEMGSHFRFDARGGIAMVVDSSAFKIWDKEEIQPFVRDLERKKMVRFENSFQEKQRERAEQFYEQRRLADRARAMEIETMRIKEEYLNDLDLLYKLQSKGMVVEIDTMHLRKAMEQSIYLLMQDLEEAEAELESEGRHETIRIKVDSN